MILLDAVYINESGGKVLLEYFIKEVEKNGLLTKIFFLLDSRLETECLSKIQEEKRLKINSTESNRRKFYKEFSLDYNTIFCFGNVPPPIKIEEKKKIFILFHNALILNSKGMNYDFRTKLSFILKKKYIKNRNSDNYKWIVQTALMKKFLSESLEIHKEAVVVLPFYEEKRFFKLNKQLPGNNGQFLFVADGVKQKNHLLLLAAWEIIFDTKKLPITLHLTIPNHFNSLIIEIERLQKKGVSIINHGRCNFEELSRLYEKCNYYISPSLSESFGLPIIEAAEAGCEIIGANLDYVFEIVNPIATFDVADKLNLAFVIESICAGNYTNKTKIIIKNKIQELIKLINYV